MTAPRRILVTGAGGVLGTELLERLRGVAGVAVTGVTRRGDPERGVLRWNLGAEAAPASFAGPWDVVIHSAASTRWTMTEGEAVDANLRSTEALSSVVGPETHLIHVSTAFALGLRGSTDSAEPVDYRNHYEWSKAASERFVLGHFRHLTIVRPPLLVGRRSDGRVTRFNGVYTFLRAAATGLAPALVADPEGYIELAPVDDVASRIVARALAEPPSKAAIDIIGRGGRALRVGPALELARDTLNGVRVRHGRVPLAACPIIEPARWDRFYLPFARQHLDRRQLRVLDLLSEFKPYLEIRTPLAITASVADVAPVLRRSLGHWAETHLAVVLADPRAWATRAAA